MKRVLGICLTTGMFAVFANVLVFSSVDYVSAQADAANKAAIDARLTERRNRIKPTLTAAEKVRVAGACVAAQAKAKAVRLIKSMLPIRPPSIS